MSIKQCEQGGHFYDSAIHNECPYCDKAVFNAPMATNLKQFIPDAQYSSDIPATMAVIPETISDIPPTMAVMPEMISDIPPTIAVIPEEIASEIPAIVTDDIPVSPVVNEQCIIDPVVGWLVITDGIDRGLDYRIRCGNNFIGHSDKMDICIRGDESISSENHALISYDDRDNKFYFTLSDGRSIVRINDKPLFTTVEVKIYDVIEVGKTKLVFIPLCSNKFKWD